MWVGYPDFQYPLRGVTINGHRMPLDQGIARIKALAHAKRVDGQPAWGGSMMSGGWQQFEADLSAFAGQPAVRLQFAFRSDGSVNYPGWYVDGLEIYDY